MECTAQSGNTYVPHFILYDGDAPSVLFGEDLVQCGCLSGAEESCQYLIEAAVRLG